MSRIRYNTDLSESNEMLRITSGYLWLKQYAYRHTGLFYLLFLILKVKCFYKLYGLSLRKNSQSVPWQVKLWDQIQELYFPKNCLYKFVIQLSLKSTHKIWIIFNNACTACLEINPLNVLSTEGSALNASILREYVCIWEEPTKFHASCIHITVLVLFLPLLLFSTHIPLIRRKIMLKSIFSCLVIEPSMSGSSLCSVVQL